ncbi:hypothetical protein [Microbacterium testaceum]|uniref:hypothetical protein n=1 Tax=Microbacterium testaceum TaxID=2033 RepID=UPI0025AF7708|nr:hypothetical protein [Microbacterium testaceum]WJS89870.1 hypothetical protein NYQ11_11090 [Microbacterium testaceum]
MSDDRFAADPDRMRQSARRISALHSRVRGLSATVEQLASRYPGAAGDGDFKESYDANYVPAAEAARAFTAQLATSVEELAQDTATVAGEFAETENVAVRESRHQK